jgi:hypothetical protein
MARIRTIKPQFWEDEKIGRLSFRSRLLYIGIWNFADDEGVVIWSPEYLRSRIFPYDDIPLADIKTLQDELINANVIFPYNSDGDSYGVVLTFRNHQVINRPVPSKLPSPDWENSKYKDAIFKRDHRICHYCGRVCETHCKEDSLTTGLSIDHVIPRSKGGNDYPGNLVTACASCNKSKGNRHKKTHTQLTDNSVTEKEMEEGNGIRNIEKEMEGKVDNKAPYGEFQNVFLSLEEFNKLKERYPDSPVRIEKLSAYIASKGKKYTSHYATILNWAQKEEGERNNGHTGTGINRPNSETGVGIGHRKTNASIKASWGSG